MREVAPEYLFVIAGNKREFDRFIDNLTDTAREFKKFTPSRYLIDGRIVEYLSEPNRLRGCRNYRMVRIGSWEGKPRKDIDLIEHIDRYNRL